MTNETGIFSFYGSSWPMITTSAAVLAPLALLGIKRIAQHFFSQSAPIQQPSIISLPERSPERSQSPMPHAAADLHAGEDSWQKLLQEVQNVEKKPLDIKPEGEKQEDWQKLMQDVRDVAIQRVTEPLATPMTDENWRSYLRKHCAAGMVGDAVLQNLVSMLSEQEFSGWQSDLIYCVPGDSKKSRQIMEYLYFNRIFEGSDVKKLADYLRSIHANWAEICDVIKRTLRAFSDDVSMKGPRLQQKTLDRLISHREYVVENSKVKRSTLENAFPDLHALR